MPRLDLPDHPRWHPPPTVLEFAELVLTGVLTALPAGLPQPPQPGPVVLEDAEGNTVALGTPNDPGKGAGDGDELSLEALRPFAHGPLRAARRTAQQVRELLPGSGDVLAVPVTGSLSAEAVRSVQEQASKESAHVLWVAIVGDGRERDLPPLALWRAVQALATETSSSAVPLVLPVPPEPAADASLITEACRALGATDVRLQEDTPSVDVSDQLGHGSMHPVFAQEWQRLQTAMAPGRFPGATIFFTGLSGSGKSTVAKALADRITEGDEQSAGRVVSLLDGDEVRRMLSAGLGFSRADRDLNILRIGWVAAEITRHGGLSICAPIAPFEQTRQQVRQLASAAGDFVLIHVSTPLEECERRDRKGLYAKARAGEIPEFTGISSPYEEPADADLRLDTSEISVEDAVERVHRLIRDRGLLTPR